MSQYSELFRTNEVDGAELASIDNKALSEDLGIGKFLIIFHSFLYYLEANFPSVTNLKGQDVYRYAEHYYFLMTDNVSLSTHFFCTMTSNGRLKVRGSSLMWETYMLLCIQLGKSEAFSPRKSVRFPGDLFKIHSKLFT